MTATFLPYGAVVDLEATGWFCARYRRSLDLKLAEEVQEHCDPRGDVVPVELRENSARIAAFHDFRYPVGFAYPNPYHPEGKRWIAVLHYLRAFLGTESASGRMLRPPVEDGEGATWFLASAGATDCGESRWAEWFIEKPLCALSVLQPDFGFADLAERATKLVGRDPMRLVWPTVLLGPEEVARRGREHVLAAPAHAIREMEWGASSCRRPSTP